MKKRRKWRKLDLKVKIEEREKWKHSETDKMFKYLLGKLEIESSGCLSSMFDVCVGMLRSLLCHCFQGFSYFIVGWFRTLLPNCLADFFLKILKRNLTEIWNSNLEAQESHELFENFLFPFSLRFSACVLIWNSIRKDSRSPSPFKGVEWFMDVSITSMNILNN